MDRGIHPAGVGGLVADPNSATVAVVHINRRSRPDRVSVNHGRAGVSGGDAVARRVT
jgi:hypothetical protein